MLHCKTSGLKLFSPQMKRRALSSIAWLKKRVKAGSGIGAPHHDVFSRAHRINAFPATKKFSVLLVAFEHCDVLPGYFQSPLPGLVPCVSNPKARMQRM